MDDARGLRGSPGAGLAGGRRRRSGFLPGGTTLFLVGVSALGAALVLARGAPHGPVLHWDSINYLAVARNLLAGEGFLNFDGTPLIRWPPLYPLLLAAAGFGVLDPLRVAGPLNAAIFGLTVFVAGRHLCRRLESGFLAVWAPLVLAVSPALGDLAWWALSGTLFVLLTTLALVQADDYLGNRRASSLLGAAAFTALAWQTRYLGIALAAAVGLLLLFFPGAPFRRRLRPAALFGLVAGTPMALWLLRNRLVSGSVVGDRDVYFAAGEILGDLAGFLAGWAGFDPAVWPLAAAALLLPAGAALLRGRASARPPRFSWRPATVFGLFAGLYLGVLLLATMAGATLFGIEGRYLAPVYIPLLVVGAVACDRLFLAVRGSGNEAATPGRAGPRGRRLPRRALGGLLALLLSLWLGGQAGRTAGAVSRANSTDLALERSYYASPWNRVEALAALREHPEAEVVFTNLHPNNRVALYHVREGRGTIRGLPLREAAEGMGRGGAAGRGRNGSAVAPVPPLLPEVLPEARLRAFFSGAPEGALVLWVDEWLWLSVPPPGFFHDYDRATLRLLPDLEPVAEFADGALFRVNRTAAAGPGSGPNRWRAAYESAFAASPPETGRPGFAASSAATYEVRLGKAALPGFEGPALTYRRAPCDEESRRARFFLHLYPEAVGDLRPERREHGFDNRDFRFEAYGTVLDGESSSPKCVAIVPLPGYPVRRIRTGQWTAAEGERWAAEIFPEADPGGGPDFWRAAYEADRNSRRPVTAGPEGRPPGATYEVRLGSAALPGFEGAALTYRREPCDEESRRARFFLHLYPEAARDLPAPRREHGFDNRDFRFEEYGAVLDRESSSPKCVAIVPLPGYPVRRLRTGQWTPVEGEHWAVEIVPGADPAFPSPAGPRPR